MVSREGESSGVKVVWSGLFHTTHFLDQELSSRLFLYLEAEWLKWEEYFQGVLTKIDFGCFPTV